MVLPSFLCSGRARGERPGEFAAPTGISAAPSGGILVADAMRGRIIIYDSLLNFSGEMTGFVPYPPESPIMLGDGSLVGTRLTLELDTGTLISSHRDGAGFYGTEWYRVVDDRPVMVRS